MTATPSALTRVNAALARIAERNIAEIWISLGDPAVLRAAAAEIDARVAAGESLPLAGLVFAAKDNIDAAGFATTAACPGFRYEPSTSATAVQRLIDAGAVLLGKTNLDQFATGLVGTRSPYGAVRSALDPDRISGGSSSGSAVAVAHGMVDFALGTDTAGSGRVPAAFNGLVGIKPTRGLVPIDGVVPACRSYDCVSVFAPTIDLATRVLTVMTGPTDLDPVSRTWPELVKLAAPPRPRLAIPRPEDLTTLAPAPLALFETAVERLRGLGAEITEIDISPFLEAATLLYDGALVAERYEAFGPFLESQTEGVDPSVLAVVRKAGTVRGSDVIADQHRLLAYRRLAETALLGYDALVLPTVPRHPTLAEVEADPLGVNAGLGVFTNFVNLMDMAAVAVPAGRHDEGLFGISFVVRAFEDQVALDLAASFTDSTAPLYPDTAIPLAVFGAHLSDQPLNGQLTTRGARLVGPVTTAADYRLYALPGTPSRPGLVPAATDGVAIEGEEWLLTAAGLGAFLTDVGEPLGVGPIRLADGRTVLGFLSSVIAGEEISHLGGWRLYLKQVTDLEQVATG